MNRLTLLLGMGSALSLALLLGGALAWSLGSPLDAGFLRDYLLYYGSQEREALRAFIDASKARGEITDQALKNYLVDEELRARLAASGHGHALESAVIADSGASRNEREARRQAEQDALDRLAARAAAWDSMRAKSQAEQKQADELRQRYEKLLEEWNRKQRDARLAQLVLDLEKSREPETLLPQLVYLPLSDLYFVLTQCKNKESRAALIALMPEEVQRGLVQVGANPAGIAR